jgi:hypothetical protein
MRGTSCAVLATAAALLLGGCTTTLSTLPDRSGTKDAGAAVLGMPYALPMAQYDVTLTRALTGCPAEKTAVIEGETLVMLEGSLAFTRTAEAAVRYGPGERYVVDYRALQAPFKTSGFTFVSNSNGTLKSINATASDESGDAVKNAVKLGLTVASVTTGSPAAALLAAAAGTASSTARSDKDNAESTAALLSQPGAALGGKGGKRLTKSQREALAKAERERAGEAKLRLEKLRALADAAQLVNYVACSESAAKSLVDGRAATDALKKATPELTAASAQVTRLTIVANLRRAQHSDVSALDQALEAQDKAKLKVEGLNDDKAEAAKDVNISRKLVWPASFRDTAASLDATPKEAERLEGLLQLRQAKLLTVADLVAWKGKLDAATQAVLRKSPAFATLLDAIPASEKVTPADPGCQGQAATVTTCVSGQTSAWIQFQRVGTGLEACSAGAVPGTDCGGYDWKITEKKPEKTAEALNANVAVKTLYGRDARDDLADAGVFVRQPAQAILWICPGSLPGKDKLDLDKPPCGGKLFASDAASTPQLGQLRYLPFRNKAFEANELALQLRDDGSIESFSYKKTKAAGSGALAAAADAATQYQAYKEAMATKAKDALADARAAQIASLQYQIDLLGKQKDLLKAQTPATPDEDQEIKDKTVHIEAQTALLTAQLAQLKAEAALATASAGGAAA